MMTGWISILGVLLIAGASMSSLDNHEESSYLQAGPLGISEEGYNLIIEHEVGGGAGYYNRYLAKPSWPGGASGVTIGVGYDLGYHTDSQIDSDWHMLSHEVRRRLKSVNGYKGRSAKNRLSLVGSLSIPWKSALEVYQGVTMPRWGVKTEGAYSGTKSLHPHCQGVMLSWTFNRGDGISEASSRDREKRAIRSSIPKTPKRVPGLIRDSIRLWVNRGLDGLIRRRHDEADLFQTGLKS